MYDVVWNDGLSAEAIVNPEFGSENAAKIEAEKYGFLIGQIPHILRTDVEGIWIHKGTEAFGGGNKSILIHTGQSSIYEASGIIEETLIHEASHTSLDFDHATSSGWVNAQNLDGRFISDYAKDNPVREDIAESFLTWLAVRYKSAKTSSTIYNTIIQTIPNRLNYFDTQNFNMNPITYDLSVTEQHNKTTISIYPNPVKSIANFSEEVSNIKITDLTGRTIRQIRASAKSVNVATLEKGTYIITATTKSGNTITKKLVKE